MIMTIVTIFGQALHVGELFTLANYRKAFEYFMMAAEQGKPDSMCNIGVMYEYGQYVRKDRREALKWYKKALDNGDPNAERYYLSLLRR